MSSDISITDWIKQYGLAKLSSPDLIIKQQTIQFEPLDETKDIKQQILQRVGQYVDLSNYAVDITERETQNGYSHRWHIDGYYARKFKTGDKYQWVQVDPKPPVISMLYYLSDYGVDFNGGILEFINDEHVKPRKNLCVMFDSKTVHRVSVQYGVKKNEESNRRFYLILLRSKS